MYIITYTYTQAKNEELQNYRFSAVTEALQVGLSQHVHRFGSPIEYPGREQAEEEYAGDTGVNREANGAREGDRL
jgi:hypothetical protein